MGEGSGTDPGEPSPYSESGGQPPPRPYDPPGPDGQPAGRQFQRAYAMPAPVAARRSNSLAIAALCCGIGSYVVGPFASIPAIILAAISLKQIRETGEGGRGMAVAGLVLGTINTLLLVLGMVLFIAFAVFALNHSCTMGTSSPRCD